MSRMVSFFVLLGILLAIGVLFLKVMAGFILPLFMAVLLVVMFRPLHAWFQRKLPGRRRLAAAVTTMALLLIFLVPLLVIIFLGIGEGVAVFRQYDPSKVGPDLAKKLDTIKSTFGLELKTEEVITQALERLKNYVAPMLLATGQYAIRLIVGLLILIVALYYFLLDGPAMISTVMRLSPLDERYESQLIEEFDRTARAVVLAAVVSALVQGILAGIGFYFAGLEAVFLLTVLSMLLAMVPFVGAAAVWVPCCVWLFWEDRTWAAALLGLWGLAVVSTIDNLIKPAILHGRSNLHPLLALLSVLGGVKALGPIGIFVGPMAVTFLYALLVMLHKEIDRLGEKAPEKAAG